MAGVESALEEAPPPPQSLQPIQNGARVSQAPSSPSLSLPTEMGTNGPNGSELAERDLLNLCLMNEAALDDACQELGTSDFSNPVYGTIFNAIQIIYKAGDEVNPTTVIEQLRLTSELERIGGTPTILTLLDVPIYPRLQAVKLLFEVWRYWLKNHQI